MINRKKTNKETINNYCRQHPTYPKQKNALAKFRDENHTM